MKTRADILGRRPQSCCVSFPCIRALYNASWQDFFPARKAPLSMACSPILNGRAGPSKVSAAAGSLMVKNTRQIPA